MQTVAVGAHGRLRPGHGVPADECLFCSVFVQNTLEPICHGNSSQTSAAFSGGLAIRSSRLQPRAHKC